MSCPLKITTQKPANKIIKQQLKPFTKPCNHHLQNIHSFQLLGHLQGLQKQREWFLKQWTTHRLCKPFQQRGLAAMGTIATHDPERGFPRREGYFRQASKDRCCTVRWNRGKGCAWPDRENAGKPWDFPVPSWWLTYPSLSRHIHIRHSQFSVFIGFAAVLKNIYS